MQLSLYSYERMNGCGKEQEKKMNDQQNLSKIILEM